ncbi:MAG: DUF924 family protein [Caulobacteraceae bacterium]
MKPSDVVTFWTQAGPKAWFKKNKAFDAEIRDRFEALHHKAARGELKAWAETPQGALALLLLLDQFPRNLFRGSAHAFATDPLARQVARAAVDRDFDTEVEPELRQFFYLPFEHSENLADQDLSVALCAKSGDAELLKWARIHHDIIHRFGRFPHRNALLGRETGAAEQAFLDEGGFAG